MTSDQDRSPPIAAPVAVPSPVALPCEFIPDGDVRTRALLHLVPGILVILGSLVGAVLVARIPSTPDRDMSPGLNPWFLSVLIPSIMAGFLLHRGWLLLSFTRRVLLDDRGVHIERPLGRSVIAWERIHAVDRGKAGLPMSAESIQTIELLDERGRRCGMISDTVFQFETLAQTLIAQTTARQGEATYVPEATEARRVERDAKTIRWAAWGFVFFALFFAGAFAFGLYESTYLGRLESDGVEVEAKVARSWMVNVTPRVEYVFEDAKGNTHRREAMMYQGADWDAAQRDRVIDIRYLPDDPSWSRILKGEDAGPSFSGSMLFVTGFGTLMMGGFAFFSLLGFDVKIEEGSVTVMRHGRIVKAFGSAVEGSPGTVSDES